MFYYVATNKGQNIAESETQWSLHQNFPFSFTICLFLQNRWNGEGKERQDHALPASRKPLKLVLDICLKERIVLQCTVKLQKDSLPGYLPFLSK